MKRLSMAVLICLSLVFVAGTSGNLLAASCGGSGSTCGHGETGETCGASDAEEVCKHISGSIEKIEGQYVYLKSPNTQYALKTKDGKTWTFFKNEKSKELTAGIKDKNIVKVTVWGRKCTSPKGHCIEVDHYKLCVKDEKGAVKCEDYFWCVVMKKMGKSTGSMEYKGVVYNFCCPSCKVEFQKNPDKYVK